MSCLVPIEACLQSPPPFTRRVGMAWGLCFGAITVVPAFFLATTPEEMLFLASCGAAMSGMAYPFIMHGWIRRTVERTLAREGYYEAAPPTAAFQHHLPCSYRATSTRCVSGLLYVADGGLAFTPHSAGDAVGRVPMTLTTGRGAVLELTTLSLHLWQRLPFFPHPPVLKVTVGVDTFEFLVPRAEGLLERIYAIYEPAVTPPQCPPGHIE